MHLLFYKIMYCGMSFVVVAAYRVPNVQTTFIDDLNAMLCGYVNQKTRLILAEDFNLPDINWEILSVGLVDMPNLEKNVRNCFQS